MVSEELPMEDALSGCRGVIDRMFFLVAEKLQTEDALSGFRVVSPSVTPLKPERAFSVCNFSQTKNGTLRL
jgi:hypothetical protein